MKMNKTIYIGAMSGTSHDAIDVSIIEIKDKVNLLYFYTHKFSTTLKEKISNQIEFNQSSLSDLGILDKEIGTSFSNAIKKAIEKSKTKISDIACIAISGQTIRHEIHKKHSFSMQIGDPNIVASKISVPVISDFRNMHIALGGQGAPLVPEFHQEIFYQKNISKIILNIGGIANYSFVKNKKSLWGSDVGPGNALMDAYCRKFLNIPFDNNGSLAAKGTVINSELKKLLNHRFFKSKFPKSTGKEVFNLTMLSKNFLNKNPSNVLATLSEFTAQSVSMAINKNKHVVKDIIVCGGGARNKDLLRRISNLTNTNVKLSDTYGYNLHAVESMAFAWLGYKRLNLMPIKIQTGNNKFNKGLVGSITQSKR